MSDADIMVTIPCAVVRDGRLKRVELTLEHAFWRALRTLIGPEPEARDRYLAAIDRARPPGMRLASAVRVDLVQRLQAPRELAS